MVILFLTAIVKALSPVLTKCYATVVSCVQQCSTYWTYSTATRT